MQVVSQSVVLHDTAIYLLELRHDAVSRIMDQFGSMNRFTVVAVTFALCLHSVGWHFQSDLPVNTTVTALIELPIVMKRRDFVTKESCSTRACMSDQCFCFG